MNHWLPLATPEGIAAEAAQRITVAARKAIASHGEFCLVLAGGSTPLACYRLLAQSEQDWPRWRLFYGDERCLPVDDPERNHRMVMATGLADHIEHHHIIPAEKGPEQAAQAYNELIATNRPFDLVLLGMGEDGHTASLFPSHAWRSGNDDAGVIAVQDSPKPPPARVSLTLDALQDCRAMLVLVSGAGKRDAVARWRNGAQLPIAEVASIQQATILIERALID